MVSKILEYDNFLKNFKIKEKYYSTSIETKIYYFKDCLISNIYADEVNVPSSIAEYWCTRI